VRILLYGHYRIAHIITDGFIDILESYPDLELVNGVKRAMFLFFLPAIKKKKDTNQPLGQSPLRCAG